jgi:hypothetical protein
LKAGPFVPADMPCCKPGSNSVAHAPDPFWFDICCSSCRIFSMAHGDAGPVGSCAGCWRNSSIIYMPNSVNRVHHNSQCLITAYVVLSGTGNLTPHALLHAWPSAHQPVPLEGAILLADFGKLAQRVCTRRALSSTQKRHCGLRV